MEKSKVSFIIVNWNGEKTIAQCLDSVLAQTYKNREIIFLDNRSSDQSLDIVKENYTLDQLVELDRNYGFAEANNRGLKQATGEYIALINNDTVLEKDWLEKAMAVFRESKSGHVGSVATKIIHYHKRHLIDSAGVEFYGLGACWDYKNWPQNAAEVNHRKPVFGACASAALYKRSVIEETGFFDSRFFVYFEDTDLSFRLRLFGYDCVYEPGAVCYHYGARRRDKKNTLFVEFGRRNIEFLFIKNMQGHLFPRYFLSHCLYEGVLFLYHICTGRAVPFVKGKIGVLGQLGYLLRERKKIKQNLIHKKRFKKLHQIEDRFTPFRLWSVLNKAKKAVWDYQIYISSD
ncbi:MAG: glycosyltransferase family 2 protein [Candidatus Aminicenantes bacterium]|nr:glycosyltransferase family 2 protein [Candidatus Aminicenantes bacterium]